MKKVLVVILVSILLMGIFITGWHFGQRGIPFIKRTKEWSIGIYKGDTPFNLKEIESNPVLTKEDVTDVDASMVADSFMIEVDSIWYMFFEVQNNYDYQTDIAYATSNDGLDWEYQKIILNEKFSQAYAYVFEWEGEQYMVPDSYQSNSIRLYKANNFPEEWSLEKILIKGKAYVDASIFRYNNKWWMFASTTSNEDLYLFYSDSLKGNWIEHPMSPVITKDKNTARPGGRIIEFNNNFYRFAQDDYPTYGNKIRAFKIIKLTEREYNEEEVVIELENSGVGWKRDGMHTIDLHQLGENEWIAVVDGYKEGFIFER